MRSSVIFITFALAACGKTETGPIITTETGPQTTPSECDTTNEDCGPGDCPGEGANMLPGSDCLACHAAGGPAAEDALFTAAGTAFADLDGTAPLVGAMVTITDSFGVSVDLTTNSVGNFFTSQPLTPPLSAELMVGSDLLTMATMPDVGGCNSCHSCDGLAGGKMYGP